MGGLHDFVTIAMRFPRKCFIYVSKVYNALKFSVMGAEVGRGCSLLGHIYLENDGKLVLGDGVHVTGGRAINRIARNVTSGLYVGKGAEIVIGDGTGISGSCLWAKNSIRIGAHVNIGADCVVMDHDGHSLSASDRRDYGVDRLNIRTAPVVIGQDAFIGARCVILKGVHIGRASIIGAGSVVTKDVPEGEMWCGNPAVFVKKVQGEQENCEERFLADARNDIEKVARNDRRGGETHA